MFQTAIREPQMCYQCSSGAGKICTDVRSDVLGDTSGGLQKQGCIPQLVHNCGFCNPELHYTQPGTAPGFIFFPFLFILF
jgi:hypothetical protein